MKQVKFLDTDTSTYLSPDWQFPVFAIQAQTNLFYQLSQSNEVYNNNSSCPQHIKLSKILKLAQI